MLVILLFAWPAFALNVDTPLPDAAQEVRAQTLFKQLRCVVCESEAIADSPATVAKELRAYVRAEIVAGKGDEQILATLTDRYGSFILMEPPTSGNTLWLWLSPIIMLAAGGLALWRMNRR